MRCRQQPERGQRAAKRTGFDVGLEIAERLREISSDLVTLIGGVGVLLIWAGLVESFFSQYHEPVVPYMAKIAFGLVELTVLTLFLWKSGSKTKLPQ